MAERRRLALLSALVIVAVSVPTPAAQSAEVMTLVPAGTVLAAMDLGQGVPDPACVARAAPYRDRHLAEADRISRLDEGRGGYFSSMYGSNCPTETGQPQCDVIRQACWEVCRTASIARNIFPDPARTACDAACNLPFQNCCYTNAVNYQNWRYDVEVKRCPTVKSSVPEPGSLKMEFSSAANALLAYEMAPWGQRKLDLWEAYQALRPAAERAADDVKRRAVFDEVRAHLKKTGATFSVVSGGGGRLWVLRADGSPVLMPTNIAAFMRMGAAGNPGEEAKRISGQIGLTPDETAKLIDTVQQWGDFSRGFKSGQVLSFHPKKSGANGAPVEWASAEHASVKGEVNGGGDFI